MFRTVARGTALAALLLVALAGSARAQYATITSNAKLKAARAAFEADKYAEAVTLATEALDVPGNGLEENLEIHRIRALGEALSGRKSAAIDSFKRLLAMDFDHRLPPVAKPAVVAAYDAAKDWWTGKPAGIVIEHDGVPMPLTGETIRVSAGMTDPLDLIRKGVLYYRNDRAKPFEHVEEDKRPTASRMELNIPGAIVTSGAEIEYYIAFLDEHGGVVARLGEGRAPRTAVVPGLPPGLLAPKKGPKDPGTMVTTSKPIPPWAIGAAGGGAAAVLLGLLIYALVPKKVDVTVVTCVGACP